MEGFESNRFAGNLDDYEEDFEEEEDIENHEKISPEGAAKKLESIQTEYKNFETPENQNRMKVLEEVFDEFNRQRQGMAVFFGGSLNAGQSMEGSDIEVQILTDGSFDQAAAKKLLSDKIHEKIGKEIEVDTWGDFIDLSKVKKSLEEIEATGKTKDMSDILSLYFYFHLSFLHMGMDCKPIISNIQSLRFKSIVLDEALRSLGAYRLHGMKPFFKNSFKKYKERLENNPKFTSLSKEEQKEILATIGNLEHEFLNY
jgi:hypothetical protein